MRSLVAGITGRDDERTSGIADEAVALYAVARRARDDAPTPPEPATPDTGPPVDPAPDPPADTEPATPRRSSWRGWNVAAAAVVAVATVATLWAALPPGAGTRAGASDTPPPITLIDNFDADRLDLDKWLPPTRGDLIYQRDGVLNLQVRAADTEVAAEARIEPRMQGTFRSISFVVAMPEVTTPGPGGPSLTLHETDGRIHKVVFGAGTDDRGTVQSIVAGLFCTRPGADCHQYDDFDPPGEYARIGPGERVPVRVVHSGGQVQLYVRDELLAQGPPGDAPFARFTFDVYGTKSEEWRAEVDSVRVED
ncbi:hypothetical protein [Pseudonocardia sp.]|uniref:hypothetical protein n=1 Tax=Pseudonocardia sp. TaxID=60912 RepID=UPI003D0EFC1E